MSPGAVSRARSAGGLRALAALLLLACVGSPATAARLGVEPASVVVTPEAGAVARLVLDFGETAPDSLRGVEWFAAASVGRVGAVTEPSPGRYEAQLRVPPLDAPATAIVVLAAQERPEAGVFHVVVPLRVRTELSARTEPGAEVLVTIGGRRFGPVTAHRTGRWRVELELRQGDRKAEVRLEDAAGNVTRHALSLPQGRHEPLVLAAGAHRLPTDGTGRAPVYAVAVDEEGAPIRDARLESRVSKGSLTSFIDNGDGVHTASYAAPADGSEGSALIELRLRRPGRDAKAVERIGLVRGEPASLRLQAAPTRLVAGGGERVALVAEVLDAAGHRLKGLPVRVVADRGSLTDPVLQDDGRTTATLTPPERVESGSIQVTAVLAEGVPTRPPARLELEVDPQELPAAWSAFTLVTATLTDAEGRPVEGELVRFRLTGGEGTVAPLAVTNADGRAFADFSASPAEGRVVVEAQASSVGGLRAEVEIEKKTGGAFVTLERPAVAAQGGRVTSAVVLEDGAHVLRDTVLITLAPGPAATLLARVEPDSLPADGRSLARIEARLADAAGNGIGDALLVMESDRGRVGDVSPTGDGTYRANLTAPLGAAPPQLTVTVRHPESGLSAQVPVTLTAGPPARLLLASSESRLPADGLSTARLTATVLDAGGAPVPGAQVDLSLSGVEAEVDTPAFTDADGRAESLLTAGLDAGRLEVRARSGEAEDSLEVELQPIGPVALIAEARPLRLPADGLARSEITVELEDALGNSMGGELVDFDLQGPGRLTALQDRSDGVGIARSWLSSSEPGTARVLVRSRSVPSLTARLEVVFEAAELEVDFFVEGPACDGGVTLVAAAPAAVSFEWDWTGDGIADGTGERLQVSLPAGRYDVTLTAADPDGVSAAVSRAVVVRERPTALATVTPGLVVSGGEVTLDASGSSSPDDSPLTYAWDWEGDSEPEDFGPVVQWKRPDGGHEARLTVTDAGGCTASAVVSAVWGEVPDLLVSVSAVGDPRQVEVGGQVDFRIDWANAGLHPASGVRVESRLDALLEAVQVPAGGVVAADGTLRFELGSLPPGASGHFIVGARVAPDLPEPTRLLVHEVRISALEPDADPGNDTDSTVVLAYEDVDLAVSLSDPAAVVLGTGDSLELTARLELFGTIDLDSTTLELSWNPDLLGELSAGLPAATAPGSAVLDTGALGAGAVLELPLSWRVPPTLPLTVQDAVVEARVFHPSRDPEPANDSDSASVRLEARPDLGLAVGARPARLPVEPGDVVLYEIDWANAGDTAAHDVRLESRFTPELVGGLVDNPHGGILQGDVLRFDLGTVPAGAAGRTSYRVQLAGQVPEAVELLENESRIDSAEAALDPAADNVDVSRLALKAPPNAWLTAEGPGTAAAGELVTWTLVAGNSGTRPATATWVEHRVTGAGLQHEAAGGSVEVTPLAEGLLVRFDTGTLAPGETVTLSHSARLLSPQGRVNPEVSSEARVGLAEADDSDPTDNLASAPLLAVRALPDLAVSLGLSDPSPRPGGSLEAVATVSSLGEAPSPGGTLILSWPAGVLATASPVELVVPPLAVGDSLRLEPVALSVAAVQAQTWNPVTIEALVSGDAGDLDPANDGDSASFGVAALPDLRVSASAQPGPFAPGEAVDVLVEWTNAGTTAASDVLLTFESGDPALAAAPLPGSLELPSVAVGESGSTSVTTTVAATLPSRVSVARVEARASAAEADAAPADDAASVDLPLLGTVDLELSALELRTFPDPPEPGATVEYAITVSNLGNAPAEGAELRFDRDPQLLLPSAALPPGATDASGRIRWPLPAIAPGQSYERSLRFVLPEAFEEETTTVAAGSTVSAPFDAVAANDAADASFTVGARVDLGVVVVLEPASDPLWAGGLVRAVAHVSNLGTKDASDVELVLELPALLVQQVLSASSGARIGPSWVRWTLPAVPAGETNLVAEASFRLSPVMPSTSTEVRVDARVSADPVLNPEAPDTLFDNASSSAVTARAAADPCVRLAAVAQPDPPSVGGLLDYELTVENAGTTGASPVTLVLELDDAFLSVQDRDGGVAGPGTITWELSGLAVGEIVTRRVRTRAPGAFPGLWYGVLASAEVAAAQDDGSGCSVRTPVVETLFSTVSDLRVEKSLIGTSEQPPRRGTRYDYRLLVENVGTAASPGASLVDRYPSALSVLDAAGAVDDGTSLTWRLPGPIASGDRFTVDYSLEVRPDLPAGLHVLRNEAQVLNDGVDAFAGNDRFVHETALQLDVDLVVELEGVPRQEPPAPGTVIDYRATVSNAGAEDALSTTLQLDLSGLAPLEGPSPGVGTDPVRVDLGTLPAGQSRTVELSARIATALPEPVNRIVVTAVAASSGGDGNPADNVDSVAHEVRAALDLRAVLRTLDRDGAPLEAGDLLDCTLALSNSGALIATGVTAQVVHDLPGFTLADPGDFTASGAGRLDAALPGGLAVTDPPVELGFTLRVDPALPSTLNLVSVCGSVASDRPDSFPADDSSCAELTAVACPELVLDFGLRAPSDPALPGQTLEALAAVTNQGSTAATGVVLTVSRDLAATVGLLSSVPPGTESAGLVTIPLGDVPVGASAQAQLDFQLAGSLPEIDYLLESQACVAAVEELCSPESACTVDALALRAPVNAWVELAVSPQAPILQPGAELTYDVAFGNDGAAPLTGVVVSVDLPEDVDVLDSGGGTLSGRTIDFRGTPELAPGQADSRTVLVRIRSALASESRVLRQVARIRHDRPDAELDTSDDVSVVEREVRASADLVVSLERTSAAPQPDGVVSYRASWRNEGTTTARSATLGVEDDPELLLVTGQPPGEFGRVFDLGDVAVGASGVQSLQYRVRRILPAVSNSLTVAVTASSATTERNPANNRAAVTDTVEARADLAVSLALEPAAGAGPCEPASATVSWTNAGSTAALGTQVVLRYAPALVQVEDSGGGANDAGRGTVTWTLPSLAAGGGGSATVRLRLACVMPRPSTTVSFEAEASSGTAEADPSDNATSASFVVEACPDLVVSVERVAVESDPLGPGGTVRHRLTVRNEGTTRAAGLVLTAEWGAPELVAEILDDGGGVPDGAAGLSWSLGSLAVGAPAVAREVELRAAELFDAYLNELLFSGSAASLDCELDPATNTSSAATSLIAPPDLQLSVTVTNLTTGSFPAEALDRVLYRYAVVNAGASPAEDVVVRSAYDPALLQWSGGGAVVGPGLVEHRRGAANPLAPAATWTASATFTVREGSVPPSSRTIARSAVAEEGAFGLSRDSDQSNNTASSSFDACYLSATIERPFAGLVCLGSSVTLRAESTVGPGATYEWSADFGSFDDPTAQVATYTPPRNPGQHVVRLSVRSPDSPCVARTEHVVVVDGTCESCGCQSAAMNLQYDGLMERVDRPGDLSASQGETVAFRVRIKETANARSATLLGGPGQTSMTFGPSGGPTYTAWLAHDVAVDCQGGGLLEFAASAVPADMPLGEYTAGFVFKTLDACGELDARTSSTGGDRIRIVAGTGQSADPGIEFTDWGPSRRQP